MGAIKESIVACKECGRKYVNLEDGEFCDSCQQEWNTEANLWTALKETRMQNKGICLKVIGETIKKVFDKAELEALIKELQNGI